MTGARLTNSVHEALTKRRKNAGVMPSLYIVTIELTQFYQAPCRGFPLVAL